MTSTAVDNQRKTNPSPPQVNAAAAARYKREDELSEILAQTEYCSQYVCTAYYMGGYVLAFARASAPELAEISRLMKACNIEAAKKAAAKSRLELSLYGLCEETGKLFVFGNNLEQIAAQRRADALEVF